ncbi:Growth arrest/ DNA-damage-inducible protein-interacting protein 1 family-containing protein [Strongyloides ratti]|uniref:Large ribosomal subunit protein mL64 n=1 Tax=Strongyloides ratti TaxID=34506 RepID=A0A090L2F7_STRRB|nr:Growth arrest/ DNA-damage-inducible protein-interacting protein 1 family-containing protein [Strongyloides ratti]CEF63877.1 Growth arrest/ DNA-damage-inducible protein-interacting protein 1 family-containing protein [Strongyloides ratti]
MNFLLKASRFKKNFILRNGCHTSINEKIMIDTKLNPRHKNIAEGKINPIQYDWEKEVSVLRERFGTYGLASNVNLSQLWPTIEEIQEIQACNLYSPYKEVLEAAKKCEEEKQKELENKLKEVEENDKKYSETTVQN